MPQKVSIILPFFNAKEYLSDAIESILVQSFEDYELILIDNNSTDGSSDIAANYSAKDKRIKIVEEPIQGIVFALNTGMDMAKGKYIARMDAEDISFPERLQKQVDFLDKNKDVGVVACQVNYFPASENKEEQEGVSLYINGNNRLITHEEISVNRFIESPMIHPTVMFRKELMKKYGGYINGDFPEDYELWLRWLEKGVKMYKLPEILYEWTDIPTRLTRIDDSYTDQAFFEVKSRYLIDWLKQNNKYYPDVVVWGAGKKSRQRFFILHELGAEAKFYIDIRENPERKVIQFQHTPPAGRNFIISYVSNRNAREKIKMFLVELGYIEGKDFLCVA